MKRKVTVIISSFALFLIIIDAKTAISGGKEGLNLCIQTVVPALLPFFVISGFLCKNLSGINLPFLTPLGKLCGIPKGAEVLLMLGFLGGYPIGAKNVCDCVSSGTLDKQTAKRMLGFCSNAGPAFIFGMAGNLFSRDSIPWFLWLVHIASAIIVGVVLPNRTNTAIVHIKKPNTPFIKIVENSAKSMANVCCWVIMFRVVIAFCKRWFFWLFPIEIQVFLTGLFELSNGVIDLSCISCEGLKFIICSVLLSFGGICVAMQTRSFTTSIGTGYYFPGKLLQGCISFVISTLLQPIILSNSEIYIAPIALIASATFVCLLSILYLYRTKNNSRKMMSNLI